MNFFSCFLGLLIEFEFKAKFGVTLEQPKEQGYYSKSFNFIFLKGREADSRGVFMVRLF